jgi:hypothetical protein
MPPENCRNDQLQPTDPVIAAAQMGQFVAEDCLMPYTIQLRPQLDRQNQPGSATAPDER